MSAEAVRAEACARLAKCRSMLGDWANERAASSIGKGAGPWRLTWSDGAAAVLKADDKATDRDQLPAMFGAWMAGEDRAAAVQWQPHKGIAQAVHVMQAIARGLPVQHCDVGPQLGADDKTGNGRAVIEYSDPTVINSSRAWGDAVISVPADIGRDERIAALAAARGRLALPYLAALLWADTAEWTIRRVGAGGELFALLFVAPEIRVAVMEIRRDKNEAKPDEDNDQGEADADAAEGAEA